MMITCECSTCSHRKVFESAAFRYDVSTGLDIVWRPCWCWQCNDVSLGEYVPSPEEIVKDAKAWRRRNQVHEYLTEVRPPLNYRDDEFEAVTLAYLDAFLAWRLARVSSEKCLTCGSDNILVSKSRLGGMFEHPDCGGMFNTHFAFRIGAFRGSIPVHWYSSEGVFHRTELD